MNLNVYAVLFSLITVGSLGLELEQNELSWTKPVNKRVDIKCRVTGLQTTYVHWYHQKDGEALVRMLYMDQSGSNPVYNPDHPEAKDFTVRRQGDVYFIKTNAVKKEHEGVYYCACWDSRYWRKIFGAGTRLYVTDPKNPARKPKLSAYPVFRPSNGRSVLLCQARDMFPDLVRFNWAYEDGTKVQLTREDELLEQRDGQGQEVRVTSMLILEKANENSKTFTCSVQHDSSIDSTNNDLKVTIPKEQETKPKPDPLPVSTCKPETEEEENKKTNPDFGSFSLVPKLNLFNLTYVSLLVKNVLYFFAVCFLLYKRRDRSSKPDLEPNQGK